MFILPTRGRPWGLQRFLHAYIETRAFAQVLVYCDDDDPCLPEYQDILPLPGHWKFVVGPRILLGAVFNIFFEQYPDEYYYGFLSDDVVPLTVHWDTALINTAGFKAVSYPDDGLTHEEIATFPVIGGDLVRAAGFLAYPGLNQYFIDTCWHRMAKDLGVLHYMPEIKFDHRHHVNHKAEVDETYQGKWIHAESDRKIFNDFWASPQSRELIERIRRALS